MHSCCTISFSVMSLCKENLFKLISKRDLENCFEKRRRKSLLSHPPSAFRPNSSPAPPSLFGPGPASHPLPPLSLSRWQAGPACQLHPLQPPPPTPSLTAEPPAASPLPHSPIPPHVLALLDAPKLVSLLPLLTSPLPTSVSTRKHQEPSPEHRRDPPRANGPNRAIPTLINRAGELHFLLRALPDQFSRDLVPSTVLAACSDVLHGRRPWSVLREPFPCHTKDRNELPSLSSFSRSFRFGFWCSVAS